MCVCGCVGVAVWAVNVTRGEAAEGRNMSRVMAVYLIDLRSYVLLRRFTLFLPFVLLKC